MNEGIIGRSTPRFRRYHEGQFYQNRFKNIKKKIKNYMKPADPDFFKNKEVPEDTENTKHFKWNDIDGYYDPKGWNPSPWGIEGQELKTILADCSILAQNYILGVENSSIGKWAEYMLHTFVFSFMLAIVLYIVFKFKVFSLMIVAPISGLSLVCFIIFRIISVKRRITSKEFKETLTEIVQFYNKETLQQRKLYLLHGSDGAYVGIAKINEATQIPHQNFYEVQGVKFDPYNDVLVKEETKEPEEPKVVNWRDNRVEDDEYAHVPAYQQ